MKVVLINPSLSVDCDDTSGEETHFFPEGLAVVASAMLRAGHDVRIIDRCIQGQRLPPKICQNAEVFGITGMINQFADIETIIPQLRKLNPQAKLVLGGPLVTCAPELIWKLLGFDMAVIGEGEKILALINKTSATSNSQFCTISATSYLRPEEFILPAFKLFDLPWYLSGIKRPHLRAVGISGNVINNLMTSRGCPRPKNCAFCGQSFGHTIRCKPISLIEQEIRTWVDTGASTIRFQDDNLTLLSTERQEQIYSLASGLKLNWVAHSRVDAVNSSMLKQMKNAGCKILYFGIETFSKKALSSTGKGATADKARKAIDMTLEAGIKPAAFFLIGLPGETKKSLQTIIRFIRDHQVFVTPCILCPIPGTPLFELAKSQISNMRDYLRHCSGWENRQLSEGKLYVNLTDLPDKLLLETYEELREFGEE